MPKVVRGPATSIACTCLNIIQSDPETNNFAWVLNAAQPRNQLIHDISFSVEQQQLDIYHSVLQHVFVRRFRNTIGCAPIHCRNYDRQSRAGAVFRDARFWGHEDSV